MAKTDILDVSPYTLTDEVLALCKHRVFIETGTGQGAGIATALALGFERIISIEASQPAYAAAYERFKDCPAVNVLYGDSALKLACVLESINEPVTLWLDAHHVGDDSMDEREISRCPLLHELKAIGNHHIKNHTIMIDDMRYFRRGFAGWGGITVRQIMQRIAEISPMYSIRFETGFCPNDILIAEVRT